MLIRQVTGKIFFDIGQIIFIYLSFGEVILIGNLIHILHKVDEDVQKERIIRQSDTDVHWICH